MKNFLKYAAVAVLSIVGFCACSDDEQTLEPQTLPVNYGNIAGVWQLAEWSGEQMDDERYLYIVIERKADEQSGARAFEMYQNLDSSLSRHLTSTYALTTDEEQNVIISGIYDHASGFWNSSYIISDLDARQMIWTVEDDVSDVSLYVRCESVPEDILNGTRSEN